MASVASASVNQSSCVRGPRPFGPHRLAAPSRLIQPRCGRRSSCIVRMAASNADDGVFSVAKLAKRIQGALPIVGLISRLAAPEGGFDDQAYPEYCRGLFDTAPQSMSTAMRSLEARHGKLATSRWVLLMCWMVTRGLGQVAAKDIVAAARRVRVTNDVEVEIDRFLGARLEARKKYDMIAPPSAPPRDQATVLADALCTLCLGLKDGQAVAPEDVPLLTDVVLGAVPAADRALVEADILARPSRARAYA